MRSTRHHDSFTIGDLSRLTGVHVETIRYYERRRLMPRTPRTAGGRRSFGPEGVQTLAFIKRSRELGFCLEDIRALLSFRGSERRCLDVKAIANRHLDDVRTKLRDLNKIEQTLANAVARCTDDRPAGCTLLDIIGMPGLSAGS